MNKRIVFAIVAGVVAASCFAGYSLPDGFKNMSDRRRVCVKREIVVIGGVTNVVTHWERNGKPDWKMPAVETNAVRFLKGVKQNNAIENARQEAEVEAAPARAVKKAAKNAAKKDLKNLQKAIADLKKARDKSSDDMKAVYEPIIALLEAEVN